ncbi:MAG: hypothetical protein HY017_22820 [Betaproteobacteria bacterium]|nr:hypothetical protein [Betaproteobacteria bacterium]
MKNFKAKTSDPWDIRKLIEIIRSPPNIEFCVPFPHLKIAYGFGFVCERTNISDGFGSEKRRNGLASRINIAATETFWSGLAGQRDMNSERHVFRRSIAAVFPKWNHSHSHIVPALEGRKGNVAQKDGSSVTNARSFVCFVKNVGVNDQNSNSDDANNDKAPGQPRNRPSPPNQFPFVVSMVTFAFRLAGRFAMCCCFVNVTCAYRAHHGYGVTSISLSLKLRAVVLAARGVWLLFIAITATSPSAHLATHGRCAKKLRVHTVIINPATAI